MSEKFYFDMLFLSKAYNNVLTRKLSEELSTMKLKGNAKCKGKLTRGLKNHTRKLVNFHANSRNSGNLNSDGLLLFKAYKILDQKVQSFVS